MEQMTGEMSSGMLMSEQRGSFTNYTVNEDDTRIKSLEEQISKQEVSFACHVAVLRCRHLSFFISPYSLWLIDANFYFDYRLAIL